MKKIIVILFFVLIIFNQTLIYGVETDEIIGEQEEALGISAFIKQASEYTDDVFEDINIKDIYKNAISGNLDLTGIIRRHIKTFWK